MLLLLCTGPEDDLACVTWSRVGCRRVLLTATKSGAVSAWTQLPPPARSGAQADMQAASVFTLGDWWCHSVGQLLPAAAQGQQQQQQEYLLSMQWLQPPPCWPYSNRVLQEHDFQAGSVPNMFAPAAPRRRPAGSLPGALEQSGSNFEDPSAELHWVEPGTLAFAAVLSSGKAAVGWATWSGMGQLRWQVSPSVPLLPAAVGADTGLLLAADATWSPSGIAVALTTQQQPSTVHVVELQGNPLHHQCLAPALRSQVPVLQAKALAAASIPAAAAPCTVISICWDPNSDAQRLVTATCSASSTAAAALNGAGSSRAGPGHVTLLSLTEQQQQQQPQPGNAAVPPTYLLTPLKAAQVTHAPGPAQWAWLLDGLLVGQQLLDRQTLVPLAMSFEQPAAASMQQQQHGVVGPELQVLTASPHGVAVAMVQSSSGTDSSSSSNSSLLLYSIPPVSKAAAGGEVAPTLAGRLVWSLLQQRHSWDLVQHLQQAAQPAGLGSTRLGAAAAAAGAGLQAGRVAQVLGLVDRKLAVQPKEVYSMYAARWDALKYAVVMRTPGGEARAFSIDLRLRLLVPVLEHHLTAAAREVRRAMPALSDTRFEQCQTLLLCLVHLVACHTPVCLAAVMAGSCLS
jgi:hypothetical protein